MPYVPVFQPFGEGWSARFAGNIMDRMFFWKAAGPEQKLESFKNFYNGYRDQQGLDGDAARVILMAGDDSP